MRPRRSLGRTVVIAAVLIGMLCCAGLIMSRIYDGPAMIGLLSGAALGSVTVSVAARRLPASTVAPISVVALAGYVVVSVRISANVGDVPGPLGDLLKDAITNGVPRLLTAMIPIRPQPDTVLVPVVVTWLAGLAAAELALRYRRVPLAYPPIIAVLCGALYLVGPNANPSPWPPLAFAAFAVAGLAVSAGSPPSASPSQRDGELPSRDHLAVRVRMALGAASGAIAVVAASAVLGPVVASKTGGAPTDPRRYVTPPRLDSLDESPLSRLSGWALDPEQRLFEVRLSAGPGEDRDLAGGRGAGGARIRLAVLGRYDGVTWRVGGEYRSAGRVLSWPVTGGDDALEAGRPSGLGREISQRITIDQLNGRLVPAAPVPDRIEGVSVAFDQRTATLALPEGLRQGLTYTVVSRPPVLNVNRLPDALVPNDAEITRRFVALPGEVPEQMRLLANQIAEGAETPYQRALAIERFLAEHYRMVADAPSGHGYPNLGFFLFGPRTGGGQRGTSEQFAAAFAVLGRMLGIPTRVAVGFQTHAGRAEVRGSDALAWPEVLFSGIGWVAFNPLPDPNAKSRPLEEDFRPKPAPSTPPPAQTPTPSASPAAPKSRSAAAPPAPPGETSGRWWFVLAGGGCLTGVLTGLAMVPPLRSARRRRRLWSGDPSARVLGAWSEVRDALRQAGREAPASLSATELRAHAVLAIAPNRHQNGQARPSAPDEALGELVNLVNLVAFAPWGVDRARADRAARVATGYVSELRAQRSRWRRLGWWLDPRPLWWSRGR